MAKTAEIVKKITTKVLVGTRPDTPAKDATGEAATNWLYEIAGRATGTKGGESNFGPWVAATGEFVAQELPVTDESKLIRSGLLFLPDVAMNLVLPAIMASKDPIEFGFRLGVKRDDAAATGYVYVAKSLIEPAATDPLQMLMARAFSAPALPDLRGEQADPETGEIPEKEKGAKTK